jgi:hypothetical protein
VLIDSFMDFQRQFGGLDSRSLLGYAVSCSISCDRESALPGADAIHETAAGGRRRDGSLLKAAAASAAHE